MSPSYPPPRRSSADALALLREALAVVLMVVGVLGTVGVLYAYDLRAGLLGTFVVLAAVGAAMGYSRTSR